MSAILDEHTSNSVVCHCIVWLQETALEILFTALLLFFLLSLTKKITFAVHMDCAVLMRNHVLSRRWGDPQTCMSEIQTTMF